MAGEITLSLRGLERRLKRHFLDETHSFFAATTPGFESFLADEIRAIGETSKITVEPGGVEFSGPFDLVYHANLLLHTANRIVLRVTKFMARSYPELYNKACRIPWELYIGFSGTVSITSSSKDSRLHHTGNIEKAVADGMIKVMNRLGRNVTVSGKADCKFMVRFSKDVCTISIDSSGELLYKRGYRMSAVEAPIRETIASALLIAAQWDRYPVVADPFCGSGTIITEAAMLGMNRIPGCYRDFAFMHWASYSEARWLRLRRSALMKERKTRKTILFASDKSKRAVIAARENIKKAGMAERIKVSCADAIRFNENGELGKSGLIISNLPYGKRIGADQDLEELFRDLGRHLKKTCRGWDFAFVSSQQRFLQIAGLKGTVLLRFENGGIPVQFVKGTVI